jgi:hypothetical protein
MKICGVQECVASDFLDVSITERHVVYIEARKLFLTTVSKN